MNGSLADTDLPCAYYVVVCETCNEILLYHSFIDTTEEKYFDRADLIWPDPGVLHPAVPKAIAATYAEAARVKNLAPNAFAVQIRRARTSPNTGFVASHLAKSESVMRHFKAG